MDLKEIKEVSTPDYRYSMILSPSFSILTIFIRFLIFLYLYFLNTIIILMNFSIFPLDMNDSGKGNKLKSMVRDRNKVLLNNFSF